MIIFIHQQVVKKKKNTSLLTKTSFDTLSRSGLAVASLTAVRDQELEFSTHSVYSHAII